MTTTTAEPVTNKKVQVANGKTPADDRFVSLSTHRLLARTVYVVGVVDGTNRLADDTTLLTTPNYERARKHANRLTRELGKVEPTHYATHLDAGMTNHIGYPVIPPGVKANGLASVEPPKPTSNNRGWIVVWLPKGQRQRKRQRFWVEADAIAFYNLLLDELENN